MLLTQKHTGIESTAGLFVLLNQKHAGDDSTAELIKNDKNLRSSKQERKSNML